ncbi:MAG: RecX family transcriptional regulator [Dehalococcoidia bacterium]
MRITSIERRPRKRRYDIHVDYALVVPLSPEVLAGAGLTTGQEISEKRIAALEEAEARHTAMSSAIRLLAFRPRSEREIRDALRTRRVPEEIAEETLSRLTELRLLDDRAFAESWTESRQRNSPRSRRMVLAELAQKGVRGEVAHESVQAIDEEEAAARAARKKSFTLRGSEFADFRRKLGDFLARRGFGYEVRNAAIKRLWVEAESNAEP